MLLHELQNDKPFLVISQLFVSKTFQNFTSNKAPEDLGRRRGLWIFNFLTIKHVKI